MRTSAKKRLTLAAAAVAAVAAAATLAAGYTFGLFSATDTLPASSFTAGTVSVATSGSVTCNLANMTPGQSSGGAPTGSNSVRACSYNLTYTGTSPAWLAVDVQVSNGSTALYDGTAAGLQLYLTDGANTTYVNGTSYQTEGSTPGTLTPGTTSDLLVSTTAATPGTGISLILNYALPAAAGNSYQGGSTTVTLTFHAVQAASNPLPADCAPGHQCNSSSSFTWS